MIKSPSNKEDITAEKLEEFEKRTKDKFARFLISDLKKRLSHIKEIGMYEILDFGRIANLVEKEEKREGLKRGNVSWSHIKSVELKVKPYRGKSERIEVKGDSTFSELSEIIQRAFDLEPLHLYEFEIGKIKLGPECDEWKEMFDGLDNFKIDYILAHQGLNEGNTFKFLYDFGDNIRFTIEIRAMKNEEPA